MTVRRPMFPPVTNERAPWGTCVYCGLGVGTERDGIWTRAKRARWHRDCVDFYMIAKGGHQRAIPYLGERDGQVCQGCGCALLKVWKAPYPVTQYWDSDALAYVETDGPMCRTQFLTGGGEVDHRAPLWSVDRKAPDAWRFWTLANLQLLCVRCHRAKTARESAERAAIRRAA